MRSARKPVEFASEAALCAAFIAAVKNAPRGWLGKEWVAYPETAGFDILLSRKEDGVQIGIEAKLSLNAKVVEQALPEGLRWNFGEVGPDFRAVLVPSGKSVGLGRICAALGITVLSMAPYDPEDRYPSYGMPWRPALPDSLWVDDWHQWCPTRRCALPDYVPDVTAGAPAPVKLTDWKVKAIKLAVLLEHRPVTRADFKALGLDPQRWTERVSGWLRATPEGYVPGTHMPDFRIQHPTNFEQIAGDFPKWSATLPTPTTGAAP